MAEDKNKEIIVEDNEQLIIVDSSTIQRMIFVVRGKQVILDSDIAMLYHVETKRLNEAVKRNIARFPEEFRFQQILARILPSSKVVR